MPGVALSTLPFYPHCPVRSLLSFSRRFASMQNTGSDTHTAICVHKTCSYAQLRLSPYIHTQTDLHACMCLCTYVYMCVCVHSLT